MDQAERLRQLADELKNEIVGPTCQTQKKRARVIAVTSGKGGVGKTNFSVNLGCHLIQLGYETMIFDADLGLANVDVLLGTSPALHLGHALSGEKEIVDLIYTGPGGLKLIAGGSGTGDLIDLPETEIHRFVQSLRRLEAMADYLIVDTGAGVGRSVTGFVLAADIVVVVTNPEPTSMTDAYAVIKQVIRQNPAANVKLVVNQATSQEEAEEAARRLSAAVLRFLGASLEYVGAIPNDPQVVRAVKQQVPFSLGSRTSPAAKAVGAIAERLTGNGGGGSTVSLFFERLRKVLTRRRSW